MTGNKKSQISEADTSKRGPGLATKKRGWSSGSSKFNQLLCNIERTLLGQLHHADQQQGSGSVPYNQLSGTLLKRKSSANKSQTPMSNSSIGCSGAIETTNKQYDSSVSRQTTTTSEQVSNSNHNDSTSNQKLGFQVKQSQQADKRKTTLNKHQRLIVSSLSSSASMLNHNNKLSIPPPHANDDARRSLANSLLFGSDTNTDLSSPETRSSARNQTSAAGAETRAGQPSTANRHLSPNAPNSSQTSVDCKLPNSAEKIAQAHSSEKQRQLFGSQPDATIRGFNNIRKQPSKANRDDEESGFANYQSRRTLSSGPDVTSAVASTTHDQDQQATGALRKSINMMQLNSLNLQGSGVMHNTHPTTQQHQLQQQQQHQQQQLAFYHNQQYSQQQQQLQQPSQLQHNSMTVIGQRQVLDPRSRGPVMSVAPNQSYILKDIQNGSISNHQQGIAEQPRQHHNLLPQVYNQYYRPPIPSVSIPTLESDQQIYANAPPKPRRYQYYDSGQAAGAALPQTLMLSPRAQAQVSVSGPSDLSSQIAHQQQVHNMVQLRWQPNQLPAGFPGYAQQPGDNFFESLTKSRSSLDTRLTPNFCHQHRLQPQSANAYQQAHSPMLFNPNQMHQTYQWQHQVPQKQASYYEKHPLEPGCLIRSKSVSHLLPDMQPPPFFQGNFKIGSHVHDPKLAGISSISTNDINQLGLIHQPGSLASPNSRLPATISKVASQQNLAIRQMQNCKSIRANNIGFDQLTSSSSFSNYHEPSLKHPDFNQHHHNLVSSAQQQLLQPSALIKHQQQNRHPSPNYFPIREQPSWLNNANERPQNHDNKPIIAQQPISSGSSDARQAGQRSYRLSQTQTKPNTASQSLDDKIKSLMLTDSDNCATLLKEKHQQVAFNDKDCNPAISVQARHSSGVVAGDRDLGSGKSCEKSDQRQLTMIESGICNTEVTAISSPVATSQHANSNSFSQAYEPHTNRIYVNAGSNQPDHTNMGNTIRRQYQVNVDQGAIRSTLSCVDMQDLSQDVWRQTTESNSHLIVDLTTPRVLAKTQTRLQPQQKTSTNSSQFTPDQPLGRVTMSTTVGGGCGAMFCIQQNYRPDDEAALERTAPYYYSDLKSSEQRKALLEIAQQKSLSPPPQLLSRSTDQSNTRLGFHCLIGQQPASGSRLFMASQQQRHHKCSSKSGNGTASAQVNKNIERLFQSPDQADKLSCHQSLLTLHANPSSLSTSQATSESLSSGYCSSEPHSKTLCKSKSLEDINKVGNPVYENICRSSKLMSTISGSQSNPTPNDAEGAQSRQTNLAVGSIDSILGSSLENSETSLDIIDELGISQTDNHLNDMTKLIEQLKANHSKLIAEYKSTLIRITKTIQKKNEQASELVVQEKLARKLHLLEAKSKRCESRSNNHLALIIMMEKVLKQSGQNANGAGRRLMGDSSVGQLKASDNSIPESTKPQAQEESNIKTSRPIQTAKAPRSGPSVVKAIVRESHSEPKVVTTELVRHSENVEVLAPDEKITSQKLVDDDATIETAEATSRTSERSSPSESDIDLLRDDEDFIEFLSSNSNVGHRSCQFEASQFDATQFSTSEFNNSTANSDSGQSGVSKDSLGSPRGSSKAEKLEQPPASKNQANGHSLTGILKRSKESERNNNIAPPANAKHGGSTKRDELETILGNVIDVDVCSVEKFSRSSPLAARRTECFN